MPAPKPPSGSKRRPWTAQELEVYYQRQGRPVPDQTRQVLEQLGLAGHMRTPRSPPPSDPAAPAAPRKRQGVNVKPILASLRSCLVHAHPEPGPALSLWFDGARMLTVNELFSIFQYRKHDTFAYKKAWRQAVARAVERLPTDQVPHFDGPTRIWLYRSGTRLVDLDALPVMFKYAIDALRTHHVIPDDNPEIIVEPRLIQEKGPPAVGMRLERLPQWQPIQTAGLRERWLGLPDPSREG